MNQIKKAVTDLQTIKEENKNIEFFAYQRYPEKLQEFFEKLNEINQSLQGYGYPVSIKTKLYSGLAKKSTYTITLIPYNEEGREILIGMKSEKNSELQVASLVNPKATFSVTNNLNEENSNESYYMPLSSFLFVQLYEKLDEIVARLEGKALKEIYQKIEFQEQFAKLDKKIKEA